MWATLLRAANNRHAVAYPAHLMVRLPEPFTGPMCLATIARVAEALFIATQRFDPADGERWQSYRQWAQIPALREVVSLDSILCPCLMSPFQYVDEDWSHIVKADYRLDYFLDLDYLLRRLPPLPRRNVLGLYRNPSRHLDAPPAQGDFAFVGYDLIEEETQISALVNCGGFPETFSNHELNEYGLIADFSRALEIQRRLPEQNPAEHHAHCQLYALWRLREAKNTTP